MDVGHELQLLLRRWNFMQFLKNRTDNSFAGARKHIIMSSLKRDKQKGQ